MKRECKICKKIFTLVNPPDKTCSKACRIANIRINNLNAYRRSEKRKKEKKEKLLLISKEVKK